uniref:Uncharacterized protein n=1 Tax=Vitis vinifera TaxID=29760 RepID=F6HJB3_VITVI
MCVTYYPKVMLSTETSQKIPVLMLRVAVTTRKPPRATIRQYSDEQRSCDTRSAAEDTNSNAQISYDCTPCTDHSDCPRDTTTQNINSNVVDAQDDEEDHMHDWLELLCKFVGWICCRRY